jgi:hypothetical protein
VGVGRGRVRARTPGEPSARDLAAPPRRRVAAVRTSPTGRGVGTFARWPLEADDGYPSPAREADPWTLLVREAMELYRTGRVDEARRLWTDDISWRVWGSGPRRELDGADAVFAYHAGLARDTDGTFRQQLLAVEGSRGPFVTAYLRTRARRGRAALDVPTLITFECRRMQIHRVVEVPGDVTAWNAFWEEAAAR